MSGKATEIIDANKATTAMTYDAYGRLTVTQRPSGSETSIEYVDFGAKTQRIRTGVTDHSADGLDVDESSLTAPAWDLSHEARRRRDDRHAIQRQLESPATGQHHVPVRRDTERLDVLRIRRARSRDLARSRRPHEAPTSYLLGQTVEYRLAGAFQDGVHLTATAT